jgi:hemoglobin
MHYTAVTAAKEEVPTGVPETPAPPPLFEQIGGRAAVERLVHRFVHRIVSDQRLLPHFARIDVSALKRSEFAFFTAAFGGTSDLDWREPAVDLDGEAASRVACHLYEVLVGFGLPDSLTEDLLLAVLSLALRTSRAAG